IYNEYTTQESRSRRRNGRGRARRLDIRLLSRQNSRMPPQPFAWAAGAEPKWIHNAARLLRRRFRRTAAEARWLRLVHLLHRSYDMSLAGAAEIATRALGAGRRGHGITSASLDGSARLAIDLDRFDSSFGAAFAAALAFSGPERRVLHMP